MVSFSASKETIYMYFHKLLYLFIDALKGISLSNFKNHIFKQEVCSLKKKYNKVHDLNYILDNHPLVELPTFLSNNYSNLINFSNSKGYAVLFLSHIHFFQDLYHEYSKTSPNVPWILYVFTLTSKSLLQKRQQINICVSKNLSETPVLDE